MSRLTLHFHDWWLLETLTWRLRVATSEQLRIAAGLKIRPWVLRLARLRAHGLIWTRTIVIPLIDVEEPLMSWVPGDSTPNFDALAWQLARRWTKADRKLVRLVWAMKNAEALVGGKAGALRQPLQVVHDVGTASVYFRRCQKSPLTAERWLSEDLFRQQHPRSARRKVPDAVILSRTGHVRAAIEFGGWYSAHRLSRLHQRLQHWHYELW